MAQPQIARFRCSQCDAGYDSDRELGDHMRATHHKFVSEHGSPPSSAPAGSAKQGCATSFIMEERGETDKLCGLTPTEKKEQYVQSDKEKETGGEG
jgi:hypothetical protein